MNLDDQMEIYKKRTDIMPDEDRIRQTIEASMASFLRSESEKILPYHSFLCIQFRLIRKRWWALQTGVLALVWAALLPAQESGTGCDTVCHTDHPGAVEEQSKLLHGDRRIDLLCPSADIFGENAVVRDYRYSADHSFLLYGGSLPADISDGTADTVYLSDDSYRLYLFRNLWEQKSGQ